MSTNCFFSTYHLRLNRLIISFQASFFIYRRCIMLVVAANNTRHPLRHYLDAVTLQYRRTQELTLLPADNEPCHWQAERQPTKRGIMTNPRVACCTLFKICNRIYQNAYLQFWRQYTLTMWLRLVTCLLQPISLCSSVS